LIALNNSYSPEKDFGEVVSSIPDDVQKFVESNIVVTGASGFVGSWIIGSWATATETMGGNGRLLLTCRDPRKIALRFPELQYHPRVTVVASDIRAFEINPSFKPNILIHAATSASEKMNLNQPIEMIDVIVSGTRKILNSAGNAGVNKVVFLSSGAVYGRGLPGSKSFSEDDLTGPSLTDTRNAYHEAKRLAELIVQIEASEACIEWTNLRLFTFLAPYLPLSTHFAAGNFILDALHGQPIRIKSGGGSIRSYQNGIDLSRFIIAVAVRNKLRTVYNVGSPTGITIQDLAREVRQVLGGRSEIRVEGIDTKESLSSYVPDVSRIRRDLSMSDIIGLSESILRTAQWARCPTAFS
jgi:nucleoside-diphosphate-sugar epimerase